MAVTRRENVLTYMNDWRGNYWHTLAPEGVAYRIAEEVVAYTGIEDSRANLRAYMDTISRMILDTTLRVTYHENLSITIEVL